MQGLSPELRRWTELPHGLSEFLQYDTVILDNAPGLGVSLAKMEAIEKYVRGGGGLIMLGGDRSFGPGGYYRTPMERALSREYGCARQNDHPKPGAHAGHR